MFFDVIYTPPSWILAVLGLLVLSGMVLYLWKENKKIKRKSFSQSVNDAYKDVLIELKNTQDMIESNNNVTKLLIQEGFTTLHARVKESATSTLVTQELVREQSTKVLYYLQELNKKSIEHKVKDQIKSL